MSDSGATAQNAAKKTGRTAAKAVRRQQLIDATIESISKYGISGTTMTTVTGIAGMSIGIVNFHFTNKQTLFEETLRFLAEEHRDQWRQSVRNAELSPRDKLLAIVDAHFRPKICNQKKLSVWFSFYGEAGYRAAYREIMSEIDEERWNVSMEICRELIKEGGYTDTDPEDVAETLEGLYDGFWLNILIYPKSFSRQDAKDRIRDYLHMTFPKHFTASGAA